MQRGNDLQQTPIFKVWFRQGSGLIDEGRLNFAEKASGANAVTCVECNPAQQSYAPKLSSVAALHESLSWVGRAFRDLFPDWTEGDHFGSFDFRTSQVSAPVRARAALQVAVKDFVSVLTSTAEVLGLQQKDLQITQLLHESENKVLTLSEQHLSAGIKGANCRAKLHSGVLTLPVLKMAANNHVKRAYRTEAAGQCTRKAARRDAQQATGQDAPTSAGQDAQMPAGQDDQNAAGLALDVADHAQAAADHAQEAADHAQQVADHAQKTADHAQKTADHAQKTADDAQEAADDAQKAADHAQEAADHAQKAADHAQEVANHAIDTAQQAGNGHNS